MAITAKVRNKQIDTGKVLHALVQGEHASGNITFQIIGEEELVEDFNSTYFYLLYTRPSDTRPNVLLLTNKQMQDDVISVTFRPTSYFTAQDGTVQIQIMATDTEGLSVDSETGTISGSIIWQTFPSAMFVHASQLTGTETIIEENVLTQYLAGMQELYSQTEDAEGDAADYAQLAKDWASKTNGAVEGGEMSAKYYAGTADSRAKEAEGYAVGTVSGSPSASFAGKNAKELASDAQDWAKGTRSDGKTPSHTSDNAKAYAESAADSAAIVSAHAEAIDAIGDDLTNIDAVAADILDDDSAIDAVAANITNVNAVAANETNINAVNTNKTNINTVAGKTTEITTVAGIASDVSAVAAIASDVAAVEDIDDDVSAVAAIAVDVGVVADAATDVAAVADGITDVGTVATNISDVGAVASDITKIAAVADDLTNIDAVADDLTNIDNAEANALKAEGWANGTQNGTDVGSTSPYYHNNAKYWAGSVPALQSKVEANSKRITNLEQKAGDYSIVQYRGTNAVPTGKAKYGLVKSIVGKSRAWNQLVENGDFSSTSGWYSRSSNVSLSASNNTATLTANVSFTATFSQFGFQRDIEGTVGHKYFFSVDVKTSVSGPYKVDLYSSSESDVFRVLSADIWTTHCGVIDAISTTDGKIYYYNAETLNIPQGATMQFRKIIVRDLTLIFGSGNEPSTVADALAQIPSLGQYNAYDAGSLVDTEVSGARSTSINIWDEQWEVGGINSVSGANDNSVSNRIRSKNFIPVSQSTAYYITCPQECYVFFYDANHNYMNRYEEYHNNVFETYTASYIKICPVSSYGTTYQNNITIAKGSTAVTYRPHILDTLSLPETVTLRSAGSVADELDVESGVITRKVSVVDLGTLAWSQKDDNAWYSWSLSNSVKATENDVIANIICSILVSDTYFYSYDAEQHDGTICVGSLGQIGIYNTAWNGKNGNQVKTILNGIYLVYELATPTTESIDPIIDNTLYTEGGGTIDTIQDQTPVIDNCLDVGYLAV